MVSLLFLCSLVLSREYQCLLEGFIGGYLTRRSYSSYAGFISFLSVLPRRGGNLQS